MGRITGLVLGFVALASIVSDCRAVTIRRDITTLSPSELTQYRDAFRAFEASGEYARIAGYHGCPGYYCHNDNRLFLPWHRAYVLEFEQGLQRIDSTAALHYWDWNSNDSISTGIPSEFTDLQYVSGGTTYPNPLRTFRFSCGSQNKNTQRFPGAPFLLDQLRQEVDRAFLATTYNVFNDNNFSPMGVQWPHGGLHGWVGGEMGSTTYAAYDPIFWAHHSNVDRQWARWQDSGNGADPSSTIKQLTLEPFGTTVAHVVNYRALGYEYDRLRVAPFTARLASMKGSLLIRNFRMPTEEESLGLYVDDMPEHPEKSYRVYVFVGQPNATADDVKADNPHFAGFFAIFGGEHDPKRERKGHVQERKSVKVLDLAPTIRKVVALRKSESSSDLTINVVATDPNGDPVDLSELPFSNISIGANGKNNDSAEPAADHGSQIDAPTRKIDDGNSAIAEAAGRKDHPLSKYAGDPVVLVFYRGLDCVHCAQQIDQLSTRLQSVKVRLVCVSDKPDATSEPGSGSSMIMLSDPDYRLFREFGCFADHPLHGTIILDRKGSIVWKDIGESPFMDIDVLLEKLAKLG